MDDELLREFITESREHLATIEADLLTIEEGGANLDEDLVNKVFRAAHSIKGGSSFFGLTRIKELAHKAETVLDMLRSRRITPNAEVTNVLLAAFDMLREMINNSAVRETADIADLVVSLTGLASSYLPQEQKASLSQTVSFPTRAGGAPVVLPQVDFERVKRAGQCVYCVHYDLIHDIEKKGLNILQLFRELAESGEVLDCALDFEAAGTLDGPIGNQLPLRLIFSTTTGPEMALELLLVGREKVELLFDPTAAQAAGANPPISAGRPAPTPAAPVLPPVLPTPTDMQTAAPPIPVPIRAAESKAPTPEAAPTPGAGAAQASTDDTLRVSVPLLETLMNLAGELVLSRNQLRAAPVPPEMSSRSRRRPAL